ncbi:MAG: SprT family zinc-dependent metalloprotease [Sulfuritalea sp.]|nr:SprT family zinc-dependent metalloprotease [Sulfuritalea sp.]MDP1985524.1 SprT family zinc-dependent metalloprotease [Sulfuritalea sp.]
MVLPDNVVVEERKVKHARIRVSESGEVRVVVPIGLSQTRIESLLAQRAGWIARQHAFFARRTANRQPTPKLAPHSFLLHGEPYAFFFNRQLRHQTHIDYRRKVVESGLMLSDPAVLGKWYKRQAGRVLRGLIAATASTYRLPFCGRIYIRDQATKWGNCSRQGNISLNWRLILASPKAAEYVALHELLHVRIKDHSPRFWVQLRSYMPDYRNAMRKLDDIGLHEDFV